MPSAASQAAAAGWAFIATLYWAAMAIIYVFSWGSALAVVAGAAVFVLLCWAIRDGAGARPRGSSWWLAGISALYTVGACWAFGLAAYIEGHGCALQPETCVDGGFPLIWKIAICAAILYFGVAWFVNRSAGRTHRDRLTTSLRVAGEAAGRQEGQ